METVNSENFSEFINSGMPVVLDLWAEWCGPCITMHPVLAQVASELEGKVKFGKLNVDKEPTIASAFKARSIPTFIVIKDGKEVHRIGGTQTKKALLYRIRQSLDL